MISIRRSLQDEDIDLLQRLQHENERLRKTLSLRGRLEEVVIENARLRRALHQYGRHSHPNCHSNVYEPTLMLTVANKCLCGLDEALKENPGA